MGLSSRLYVILKRGEERIVLMASSRIPVPSMEYEYVHDKDYNSFSIVRKQVLCPLGLYEKITGKKLFHTFFRPRYSYS